MPSLYCTSCKTELHFCLHPSPFSRNADKQRDCKGETISLKLHPLSSPPTESKRSLRGNILYLRRNYLPHKGQIIAP